MHCRFPNNASFADFVSPRLELRLDECHQSGLRFCKRDGPFEDFGKADKACIADDDVDWLGNMCGRQNARAGSFKHDYAGVLSQGPGQLICTTVHSIDARRTLFEQNVGEAAGRASDVDGDVVGDVPAKVIKAVGKLDTAARHPRMIAAANLQWGVIGERLSSLSDLAFAAENESSEDQRLRAASAFGKAAFDKDLIGALFGHCCAMLRTTCDGKSGLGVGWVASSILRAMTRSMRPLLALSVLALAVGCVSRPAPKSPTPQASPPPSPAPPPTSVLPQSWIDWPITPGDWAYRKDAGGSIASFGAPGAGAVFQLHCDRGAHGVFALRAGAFPDGEGGQMVIRATTGTKIYPAVNNGEGSPYIAARIEPSDSHLDAIAFSRGRFLVTVKGGADLVIPSWPEVSRVVEDCRS
jgi:hypothetical protein